MENNMFCFQCQETAKGFGCTLKGVCGKNATTARNMDLLLFVVRGISVVADQLRQYALPVEENVDNFIADALFCTITNANFDDESIVKRIGKGLAIRDELKHRASSKNIPLPEADELNWKGDRDEYDTKAATVGVLRETNEDLRSLKELIMYGLKGMAAYLEHAMRLGHNDESIHRFMQHTIAQLTTKSLSADELTALALKTGETGVQTMALLDKANTSSYGNPEITRVNIGAGTRPGILISGHDLHDLEELLEQTKNSGVDVYTHGEMLPAHYYPAFKKYTHFAGNYGNAWWKQREEFTSFNGPILFTTNCIVPPLPNATYKERMFTTNSTGYPGCKHIAADEKGHKDYTEIIEAAKKAHAHKFIIQLKDGYDTMISEEGGNLSQGQKQLLCIARIMLVKPPMLILDEATSSIDTRTEKQIQEAFDLMMEGRTTFIVAHRLSTIQKADQILVMNHGQIIEQGKHEELLKKNGFYHHLYYSQFEIQK